MIPTFILQRLAGTNSGKIIFEEFCLKQNLLFFSRLNHFFLWHEKEDGNVSKLLKFKFLVPHGYRSITGVMLDTSDDYFNHGHMKIGFDTYAYDVKLFLELR